MSTSISIVVSAKVVHPKVAEYTPLRPRIDPTAGARKGLSKIEFARLEKVGVRSCHVKAWWVRQRRTACAVQTSPRAVAAFALWDSVNSF